MEGPAGALGADGGAAHLEVRSVFDGRSVRCFFGEDMREAAEAGGRIVSAEGMLRRGAGGRPAAIRPDRRRRWAPAACGTSPASLPGSATRRSTCGARSGAGRGYGRHRTRGGVLLHIDFRALSLLPW